MAYSDFTLNALTKQFNLTLDETTDLYSQVPEVTISELLRTVLQDNIPLALAIANEKARSELIIAPILVELWRMNDRRIGLFSGVEFTVDPAAGLAGVCDFILTRSPEQLFVRAPLVMLVEAKNEDMKRGYAQCIAEMVAAQQFNEQEGVGGSTIHGVVTTGNIWRFLKLEGTMGWIDRREYHVERLEKIMGILVHLTAEGNTK